MRDTEKLTQNEAKILYDIPIYRTVAQATVLHQNKLTFPAPWSAGDHPPSSADR